MEMKRLTFLFFIPYKTCLLMGNPIWEKGIKFLILNSSVYFCIWELNVVGLIYK